MARHAYDNYRSEFDTSYANDNYGDRRSRLGNYQRAPQYNREEGMAYGYPSGSRRMYGEHRDYSERYGRPETRNFDYDDEMNYGGRSRSRFNEDKSGRYGRYGQGNYRETDTYYHEPQGMYRPERYSAEEYGRGYDRAYFDRGRYGNPESPRYEEAGYYGDESEWESRPRVMRNR
jgi:hypothetical protein